VHAPTLTLDWARSLVGLGQFVEAQERYELIIREGVDAKSPQSWQRALSDAKAELAALKPRLAWVTIAVTGSKDAHVTVDGVAVPAAAIGVRRAVNPGAHDLVAEAQGYLASRKALKLAEGQEGSVTLALEVDPEQQQLAPVLVAATEPTPAADPAHDPNRTPAYIAFGVAGAGLVVGGITGIMALGKSSTLKKDCPNPDECPYPETIQTYHTLGYVSGAGFIVGAAGIATGVTLLLLNQSPSTSTRGLVVRPYLGVGSVGATGTF